MLESHIFTPAWLASKSDDLKPRFTLRRGSILERDELEAELDGRWGAGEVYGFVISDLAQKGVRELVKGPDADELIHCIQSHFSGQELNLEERAKVKAALDLLHKHYPEYKIAIEQEARRNRILPSLAFMRYCTGWENVKDAQGALIPYERDDAGDISDTCVLRINRIILRAAGMRAFELQYGWAEAKNSEPPLKSSPPPKGSRSRGGSKAGGSSVNGKAKKTRNTGAPAG